MILQAGMRTDIVAFYSDWFMNRINEGFVLVRNPYDVHSVTYYNLSPKVVDLIGFCTKNPYPMLSHLDALKHYGMYWFVTITPYGRDIEPFVPDKYFVMESFKALSLKVSVNNIAWRYDPIFLTEKYSIEYHVRAFQKMCKILSGYTRVCVISFIDLYKNVQKNFPEAKVVSATERMAIGKVFSEIAAKYAIELRACAEGHDLEIYGVRCNGCATTSIYEAALGQKLTLPHKANVRDTCSCHIGNDIGAYETCPHLCRYCYANKNKERVLENVKKHNAKSPFLTGDLLPEDVLHQARQQSFKDNRMSMF